jgi:hypothetical protein
MGAINIIMMKPPGPESQFVEIEDDEGHSIDVGTWMPMPPLDGTPHDGWWKLRIESLPDP